ncbi:acetyl esterase/lipase [Rhizomicrobium palustre]|uniref:Acetyl esterase/lipase n=1 Tax=Rhizomicrobium palustre TaxID=189966 RepID=A0A846N1H2_9PROT|nr:alpha/beta hydrolase [Rhizomicrobium palustre]NIK89443.1 acetyl esterase/lipase [Rhizomicrobium palustre]
MIDLAKAALWAALLSLAVLIPAKAAPLDPAQAFPPKMQSFALYGTAAIPNSKPGPDEENGTGWVLKVSRPAIQVYLPAKIKATGASVLIIPGGGYAGLTFEYEGVQQAQYFVDHGIAAFVLKYRLPSDQTMTDKSIGPLQDAQQGMRFIRLHAKEWALDPARVGVIGYSAGGHIASTLATHFEKSTIDNPDKISLRPDFQILVYPVISMTAKVTHMDSRNALLGPSPSDDLVAQFSSEMQVTAKTPPALLLHAVDDQLVDIDNSIVYLEALRHAGVPVEARFFEKGQHGFALIPRDRWQGTIMEWLTTQGWLYPKAK